MKLIDFWAEWCNPCKMMNPILDEVVKEYNIELTKYDADQDKDMLEKYNITSIPTYIIVDDQGNELKRIVGAMPKFRFVNELGLTK